MGTELGELYYLLSNEVTWLYWRWHEYVTLYTESDRRLEILNSSAPFFFYVVQRVLWDETLLGISRLAGPEATGRKRNLSVHRILPFMAGTAVAEKVEALLKEVTEKSASAIDLRNRHIAHRDLDVVLGKAATPLPQVTKETVDAALAALAALLNAVQSHFQVGTTTAYQFASSPHGAETLLYVLRDGLKREQARTKKLEDGIYDPDDWNDRDPPL
jgi:hypothetical protein